MPRQSDLAADDTARSDARRTTARLSSKGDPSFDASTPCLATRENLAHPGTNGLYFCSDSVLL